MNEARLSLAANRNQTLDAAYKWADDALKKHADIILEFEIIRDGELRVSLPHFSDQDLAYASRAFAEQDGHDFDKWIADQAYFFLRDISHKHQHHDDAVDTILILQKAGDDDVAWRRNIIFSLHFYIISARRTRDARSLIRALGILAYYKSFAALSKIKLGDLFNQIPVFQDEALKDSLDAAIDERAFIDGLEQRQIDRTTNFRVMTLAVIAPILALIGVAIQPHIGGSENERDFPAINAVANFVSGNAIPLCTFAVLALLVLWTINSTLSAANRDAHARQILSLGVVNERWAAAVSVAVCVGFLIFGFYFGHSTVKALFDVFSATH